ncbi:MAG: hypothetical protein JWM98_2221 [Thermoleophilia bacterium]|nr:hypothetical protein [Thermoleophilia bacterium]
MTTIDVDTPPLQAAREWRGINLVVAARNAGLPVVQAEALEEGDPSAFGSIDEMIASAVVYGASIGIGRDEAVALLDRTVCGTGAEVALPDVDPEEDRAPARAGGFSSAVRSRSAEISDRAWTSAPISLPVDDESDEAAGDLADHPALDSLVIVPSAAALAVDPTDATGGPTPEQAVAASGEIHLDDTFGPEAPWERPAPAGELESWAAGDYDDDDYSSGGGSAVVRRAGGGGVLARVGSGSHAAIERVLGTDRADAAADWASRTTSRTGELVRDGRERLRRSEHGTLILAIAVGAVLIALLVAIGGALGGSDGKPSPSSSTRADTGGPALTAPGSSEGVAAPAKAGAAKATTTKAAAPAKEAAIVPPARLTVDVYNDGHQKGYAKTVAAQVAAAHYRVGEVTNAKGDYATATIIYPKGMLREARALSERVGVTTLQEAPGASRRFTLIVK